MAIHGIDTQIMVTRSADFARDTVAAANKDAFRQDFLNIQVQAREEHDNQSVAKAEKGDEARLYTGEEDGGGGLGGGGGDSAPLENESPEPEAPKIPTSPYEGTIIDIQV
jgi:hypothetical protein